MLKIEQKPDIINVFKLIYLYLNEDLLQFTNINLIENLIGNICRKYQVSSLSKIKFKKEFLLLNVVIRNYVKLDQFTKIREFINKNPSCLNSLNLIRSNKPVSYITFILNEFYEFLQLKAEDGTLIISIKEMKSNLEENLVKIEKLKLLI